MNYENYEDLNKAKKRIMSLMKTKYGDVGEDYQESVDTDADEKMNNIIKQLNGAQTHAFNMIPLIKLKSSTGNAYYRNEQSIMVFNQHVLSLSTSLTYVNRIFRTLIDDIGYVEPETLDIYKKSFDTFMRDFSKLNHIANVNGVLTITMSKGSQNEFDNNQVINEFNNAMLETDELVKFNDVIRHNYNYKSLTVSAKKNNYIPVMKSESNYYNDDNE